MTAIETLSSAAYLLDWESLTRLIAGKASSPRAFSRACPSRGGNARSGWRWPFKENNGDCRGTVERKRIR